MRHAAGQGADRFELLRLAELLLARAQRLLCALPLLDLLREHDVRLGELGGALLQFSVLLCERLDQVVVGTAQRLDLGRGAPRLKPTRVIATLSHRSHEADEGAQRREQRARHEPASQTGEQDREAAVQQEVEPQGARQRAERAIQGLQQIERDRPSGRVETQRQRRCHEVRAREPHGTPPPCQDGRRHRRLGQRGGDDLVRTGDHHFTPERSLEALHVRGIEPVAQDQCTDRDALQHDGHAPDLEVLAGEPHHSKADGIAGLRRVEGQAHHLKRREVRTARRPGTALRARRQHHAPMVRHHEQVLAQPGRDVLHLALDRGEQLRVQHARRRLDAVGLHRRPQRRALRDHR